MKETLRWELSFQIEDSAIQQCLDELVLLFRRGRLTPQDIESVIDVLESSEKALTVSFRNLRRNAATRTSVVSICLEPSDRLVDLLATVRARPAMAASLAQV